VISLCGQRAGFFYSQNRLFLQTLFANNALARNKGAKGRLSAAVHNMA
jgi:hypothetical protein